MVRQHLDEVPVDMEYRNFKAHQDSLLFYWTRKMLSSPHELSSMPLIGMVKIESFYAPAIGVPYDIEGNQDPHAALILRPRYEWSDILKDKMKTRRKRKRKRKQKTGI